MDPPDLAAAFDDSQPIVLTGQAGLIAQVVKSAAVWGNYRYGLIDGVGDNADFTIGGDGRALEFDGGSGYADDLDGGGDGQ